MRTKSVQYTLQTLNDGGTERHAPYILYKKQKNKKTISIINSRLEKNNSSCSFIIDDLPMCQCPQCAPTTPTGPTAVSVSATSPTLCHVTMSPATVPVIKDGQVPRVTQTSMSVSRIHSAAVTRMTPAPTWRVDLPVCVMTAMNGIPTTPAGVSVMTGYICYRYFLCRF